MKNSKRVMSGFILFALAVIGVTAQAQRRAAPVTDRQVSSILQRIERSTNTFRNSLNIALVNQRVDQTRPQNDINNFEPDLGSAIDQFKNRFATRQAGTVDVQNILQKASLVNGFMSRHRLDTRVQNNWAAVRTDLNALATAYGITWQWNREQGSTSQSYRLRDSELNQLIQRIESGGNRFQSSLTDAFSRSRYDQRNSDVNMNDDVRDFNNATAQLRNQHNTRQPVADDVERVLALARPIDTFMRGNQLTNRAQSDWSTLKNELNTLAAAFNVSANWQDGNQPSLPQYNSNSRLTGTYRLDSSRSDNPRDVIDRATQNLPSNQRQGVYDRMIARLESPQMLAIERNNSTLSMASTRAQRSTFEADGVERQEQLNGRTSRVTATLRGDQLVVKSTGYRENDFNVTFEPIENGRRLRVTREVFTDRLNQPVIVNSIYDRTSDVAQWNIYNGSGPVLNTGTNNGEFILRDGETVVAVLNNDLTTKRTRQGERFTLTVREPGQYEGAVIEGTVASVTQSGTLTGRSGMTLNFDTIQLRNGQTYRFAGTLSSVRNANGDTVRVDNEGSAQGDNQTNQTVTRTGVGTAIGAIIGAIAGGGKGAAIGAAIGAAGGAGSVFVTGKESLELPQGTELTIRAGSPR
ncbi:MAG: YMGG-like glycine zipper-containing protein [Pyrinomonadaceae bacterium]